jgi:hypothetical protein
MSGLTTIPPLKPICIGVLNSVRHPGNAGLVLAVGAAFDPPHEGHRAD